jgi:hypothetical protein
MTSSNPPWNEWTADCDVYRDVYINHLVVTGNVDIVELSLAKQAAIHVCDPSLSWSQTVIVITNSGQIDI